MIPLLNSQDDAHFLNLLHPTTVTPRLPLSLKTRNVPHSESRASLFFNDMIAAHHRESMVIKKCAASANPVGLSFAIP